jgi:hypothetical protein
MGRSPFSIDFFNQHAITIAGIPFLPAGWQSKFEMTITTRHAELVSASPQRELRTSC